MCITLEALVMFLNLLPAEIVETRPGEIIVRADTRDAVWVASGDLWCTEAPRIDSALRLKS